VDTRIFACTPRVFRELFAARVDLMRQDVLDRSGYSAPEERLFEELLPERDRFGIVPRLRHEPRIEGYSGHGQDYGRTSRRLWTATRGVVRTLCPPLWI
jgi:hypothetical protein